MEIKHFQDHADRGFLFGNLKVLDLRQDRQRRGGFMTEADWRKIVCAVPNSKLRRADGEPDQRYNSWWDDNDVKLWPLRDLSKQLVDIAEEGDLYDPFHKWKNPNFRPAQVATDGVFLLGWQSVPLYEIGGYRAFKLNVDRLSATYTFFDKS